MLREGRVSYTPITTTTTTRCAHAEEGLCPLSVQVTTGDLDGFQADTEEEEEEDGDCVMMDISDVTGENGFRPSSLIQTGKGRTFHLPSHPLIYNGGWVKRSQKAVGRLA